MSPETIFYLLVWIIVTCIGIVGAILFVALIAGCIFAYQTIKEVMKNEE